MQTLQEYKCPCCGGAISFDSSIQKMKCPYCDTEFEMEALQSLDEALCSEAPSEIEWDTHAGSEWSAAEAGGMRQYVCKSCGGGIVAEETTAATSCPFCGNPITMTGNLSGMLKPDLVIPFKLDKKAAKESLLRHYQGKRLLPKVFKDENHIDEIKGVYVPFWLFGGDAEANITYDATRVRTWSDSKYNYTETSHFNAYRKGRLSFADIPVDGSKKMADDLMQSIEPFDMRDAVDFQTAYLSGYLADKYDVDAEQCIPRANERVKASTEQVFADTVTGYLAVHPKSSSVHLSGGKAKYALLPVWLLNTTWNNKKYTFAMNGQTGKFVGNLPVDRGAYWKWWGISAAICSAISFGIFSFLFYL